MKKSELAFILSERGVNVLSHYKVADLKERLNPEPTEEEMKLVNEWIECAKTVDIGYYYKYSNRELKGFFQLKTRYCFPIPLSFLGKNVREMIIAWYHVKGHPIVYPKVTFTKEQSQLLDGKLSGLTVVNAGPGTGKTTVANERGYRLVGDGVILISYTNQAINENYRRMKEYPGLSKSIGKKNPKKQFNVTTVDSLAHWIFGVESTDHDAIVQAAIDKLKLNPDSIDRFYIPGRGPKFKHIIVDECQDIDDLRGELIMTYFQSIPDVTLTLFGDPRQRIQDGCGKWYSKLWSDQTYRGEKIQVRKIGFSTTFRFKNPKVLDLVNELSARRVELHHQLKSHHGVTQDEKVEAIALVGLPPGKDEQGLSLICNYIKNVLHLNHNVSYENMAVICPSIDGNNKSSRQALRVCTYFREYGIPVKTSSGGSYQPRGILFTTIHSAKGKEFDYVFLVGMSGYPERYAQIEYQIGEGLVFVAHSRAKRSMYYLSPPDFQPPRGVSSIQGHIPVDLPMKRVLPEPSQKEWTSSELSQSRNLMKFLNVNEYKCELQPMEDIPIPEMKELTPQVDTKSHITVECIAPEGSDVVISTSSDTSALHLQLIQYVTGKQAVVIKDNTVYRSKSNRTQSHWNYLLPIFIQLHRHVILTQFRRSRVIEKGIIPPEFPPNTYTIDTEFHGIGVKGGSKIFDLALISLNDPYSSIVQTANIKGDGLKFAVEWIDQPKELFETSGTIRDIKRIFDVIVHRNHSEPIMVHYIAKVDVDWYDRGCSIDLGMSSKNLAQKLGYFSDGSQPPRLTDLYSSVATPVDFQPHITPHTAVSDALILYELLHTGILSIEGLPRKNKVGHVVKPPTPPNQDQSILSMLGF